MNISLYFLHFTFFKVSSAHLKFSSNKWFADASIVFCFYLKRLNKSVEKYSDTNTSSQKLDQSGSSEEFEETNLDKFSDVYDATDNSDEIKCVPRVFEVVLK